MLTTLHQLAVAALPDNTPEMIANIIIIVATWWLSRKTKKIRRF